MSRQQLPYVWRAVVSFVMLLLTLWTVAATRQWWIALGCYVAAANWSGYLYDQALRWLSAREEKKA